MEKNKQTQKVGDNSTSLQVGGNLQITQGITYTDAKEIALDVFKSNFYQLSMKAEEVAKLRAEEITEAYLNGLEERSPENIQQLNDPDMQYALFTAQKEYARTGDKDLSDLLVNLLIERTICNTRSLQQIVLNESISTVAQLTSSQLDILSLIFMLRYSTRTDLTSLEALNKLAMTIEPFLENITDEVTYFQHLEYAGCGSIGLESKQLETTFLNLYPGLFSKGFSKQELVDLTNNFSILPTLLTTCLHNNDLFQFRSLNDDVLTKRCSDLGLSNELTDKFKALQSNNLLSEHEVYIFLSQFNPVYKTLLDYWKSSIIGRITLTTVGMAIGHANTERKTGEKNSLSKWIP